MTVLSLAAVTGTLSEFEEGDRRGRSQLDRHELSGAIFLLRE